MSTNAGPQFSKTESQYPWLESISAFVLLLVLITLGWMILAAYQPGWGEWATTEAQVVGIVILLSVALLLVSVVALLHTRRPKE